MSDQANAEQIAAVIEQAVKPKRGRKKTVKPEGDVIELEVKPDTEGAEPEVISYGKAKQLIKERKPYKASEKQMENARRLVEMNKTRREEQKKKDAEEKEAEDKAKALEDAKIKKKKYIVLPKGERTRKAKKETIQRHPADDLDSCESSDLSGGETTDTRVIKKKINHIKKIDDEIKQVASNPYLSMLKKAGF